MKNNKILRIICYILVPIIVAILILSSLYLITISQNNFSTKEEYFKSQAFFSSYAYDFQIIMEELIFAKEENYVMSMDGEYKIFHVNFNNYNDLKDYYFLAIYEQKVLTNVREEGINTVEDIKQYILQKNEQFFNTNNGEFYSNVENFAETVNDYGYLAGVSIPYYTIGNEKYGYGDEPEEVYVIPNTDEIYLNEEINQRIYRRAYLNDFSIYSTYAEEFNENNYMSFYLSFLNVAKDYQTVIYLSIPISIIALILIAIFLINSIGYKKDCKEVELADFDRVPIELLILIYFIILGISLIIIDELHFSVATFANSAIIITSLYILNAIFIEVILITIIKRLKAKQFIKTSFVGKFIVKAWKIIKKIFYFMIEKFMKLKNNVSENVDITWKVIFVVILYVIITIILLLLLGPIGLAIPLALFGYILYIVLLEINSFKKLEKGLKNIYEGDNKSKLNSEDFRPEFKNVVKYVNDISNGFENVVEESLKSERLKTELITNVSHDIKTPLTSIINYVDLLKSENIENEKAKEYIGILDNKSQRLKKLIEDLVEASKASSGSVNLNLEKINIIELIKQAMGEFEDRFAQKKLEIISELPKNNVEVKADSRYMYRVIENLFSNVSKYALDSSRVYIDTKVIDKKIKIEIKNISQDRLNITEEELMQRFVRGDKSRTTEGNGLGLAIARSLTQLQGGKLVCKIDGDLFKVEIELDII